MENRFTTDFKVTFFETDIKGKITPGYLLAFFQDTAINHSENLGYGIERLMEEKRGWAILNWHISVECMPGLSDELTVTTWCGKCGRHQAERSFTINTEKGELLACAVTNWAFIDLEKRKPAVIPQDMEEIFVSDIPSVMENEKYRIRRPAEEELTYVRSFRVERSDLDTNGHVNNTKYLVWAVDCVDDEIYDNYDIYDIKVTYRKEAKRGNEIVSEKAVYYDGNTVETVIYFTDKDEPRAIFAQISLGWKKR